MNKIGELAIGTLQQTHDHQGPKTEFTKKGSKNVSRGIYVTYPNYKIHKFKNYLFIQLFYICCPEMNGVSNPHKISLWALMITIKVSVAMFQLPICEFS